MKKCLITILLTTVIVFSLSAQIQQFTWQGVEREYIVHTPANHEGPMPVLFFLHGLNKLILPCDQEFNFSQMAEDFGWAIVIPQALNLGLGAMWNAGLIESSVDDAGFLLALLDSLTVPLQLNPDSVFFTGFSMGGFMTHRMAIEHGDRITACASVSGLISYSMAAQTPVTPVRMLHIHGSSDNVVGYSGYSAYFHTDIGLGVSDVLNYWQNANGCNGAPTVDTFPDLKDDGLRFIRYTYNCGTDLQLLKVANGLHAWYGDTNQYDVDYKEIIYEFFTGHPLSSAIPVHKMEPLHVWPNPTQGILHIQITDPDSPEIQVFDIYGKLMDVVKTVCVSFPQTIQIDLSHFPNGVYFVREQSGTVTKVILKR